MCIEIENDGQIYKNHYSQNKIKPSSKEVKTKKIFATILSQKSNDTYSSDIVAFESTHSPPSLSSKMLELKARRAESSRKSYAKKKERKALLPEAELKILKEKRAVWKHKSYIKSKAIAILPSGGNLEIYQEIKNACTLITELNQKKRKIILTPEEELELNSAKIFCKSQCD